MDVRRRFAFYDQIHTTGMDIKHMPNACALLTIGKDMVFRDLAQGAYRMRGIGKGQAIELLLIPEIETMISKQLDKSIGKKPIENGSRAISLIDIVIWLLANSIKSEKLQGSQLMLQNAANVFRKNAFKILALKSKHICSSAREDDFQDAIKVFREEVRFDIPTTIPKSIGLLEKVQKYETVFCRLIAGDDSSSVRLKSIKDSMGFPGVIDTNLEDEKHLEQEVEQEQVFYIVCLEVCF